MKVNELKGIGTKKEAALKKMSIESVEDLLYLFPREYQDRSYVTNIAQLQSERPALVKGRILVVNQFSGRTKKKVVNILIEDDSGKMEIIFF